MPERLDKTKITDELEQLQLEETRERVQDMRNKRQQRLNRSRQIQLSLKETKRQEEHTSANCWHKKGGKGVQNLLHGNDANYAVVKHTLSHGPTIVICQRCPKVWEPPPLRLNRKGASPEEKAEYKRLYNEYQWALALPTDNEPSGTQLFVISRETAA